MEYCKINTIYKRDMSTKDKRLIDGDWSMPEFEYLKGNPWVFTEKVDGTNIRIQFKGESIIFGGRTDAAQIPAKLFARLNEKFLPLLGTFKEHFADGCILYGEGHGAGIQGGGGNYRKDQDFVLFDVLIGEWWLQRPDIEDVASKLGLQVVPVIGEGTLLQAASMAKAGIKSDWGDFQAEGIVARPKVELKTRSGHRIIAKIKCKDFKKEVKPE